MVPNAGFDVGLGLEERLGFGPGGDGERLGRGEGLARGGRDRLGRAARERAELQLVALVLGDGRGDLRVAPRHVLAEDRRDLAALRQLRLRRHQRRAQRLRITEREKTLNRPLVRSSKSLASLPSKRRARAAISALADASSRRKHARACMCVSFLTRTGTFPV